MATLAVKVRLAYLRAWKAYGQPVMTVVKQIADWDLPAGYTYDPVVDRVADAGHNVLPNPEDYWVTASIYIVPDKNPAALRNLAAQGLVPDGTMAVGILSDDAAVVAAAHAVQLDGQWYDVAAVEAGLNAGWQLVRLTRRS